ncbi:hypothetical protein LTR78_003416 [Recurvomyces mirabilis]|uniref:Uncharacterized protein n=1 Tax=Recurvomyces mirabilis TaxID=574656 RepID=A0AAE0WRL6_9PEZI|nr:hypothetical protein LTR78_003416 [Recurvomyces mirabilis]KAK5154550.1 hypothetical protein LTS14_006687 [Recurvomyces mirabilis]
MSHWDINTTTPAVGLTLATLQAQLLGSDRGNAVLPSAAVMNEMERQEAQRQQQRRTLRRDQEAAERRRARLFETEEERREAEEDLKDEETIAEIEGWVRVELTEEGVGMLWEVLGMRLGSGDVVWVRREPEEVRRR